MDEHSSGAVLMPIVVGAPRSGTTLLRLMLDAHPDLAIPPETGFLSLCDEWQLAPPPSPEALVDTISRFPPEAPTWPDFGLSADALRAAITGRGRFDVAEAVRTFYRAYAARHGKSRFGDKTPLYSFHVASIQRLLPEARFIHLVRDGRAVAHSWRRTWFSPGPDITAVADAWQRQVDAVRRAIVEQRVPVLEVLYEALVRTPEPVLRKVCAWIDLPFHPSMLAYHRGAAERLTEHGARVGGDGRVIVTREQRLAQQAAVHRPPDVSRIDAWSVEMSEDDRAAFARIAGRTLSAYGFPTETCMPAGGAAGT